MANVLNLRSDELQTSTTA